MPSNSRGHPADDICHTSLGHSALCLYALSQAVKVGQNLAMPICASLHFMVCMFFQRSKDAT
jgi:hypothetical protein